MSLSRFNKGIVGSFDATHDQRRLRASRSAVLAALKQRSLDFQAKYRKQAIQRRIDNQQSAAAARRARLRDKNG